MDEGELPTEAVLRATQVGDTLRMMIDKASLRAEVRDRVSPVLQSTPDSAGVPTVEGFVKDAGGEWDLDSVTGAKGATVVEIVVRRIAATI
jgi:hypothetical protein